MEVLLSTDAAGLQKRAAQDMDGFAAAVGDTIQDVVNWAKERVRARVLVAFRGQRRIATIIRSAYFPAKGDKPPSGYLYTNWFQRGHEVLGVFATGATILPRRGQYLFVPADNAPPQKRIARLALELVGHAPNIAIIRTRKGGLLLIERQKRMTKILGRFVKRVRMPKRFSIDDVEKTASVRLEEGLLANLDRRGI
jgi:hypothetical protein